MVINQLTMALQLDASQLEWSTVGHLGQSGMGQLELFFRYVLRVCSFLFSLITLFSLIDLPFQRAGAHDEKGKPVIKDFFGSPLTARYALVVSNAA